MHASSRSFFISAAPFLLFSYSCKKLPAKRPSNFQITITTTGGMIPAGATLFLSSGKSYLEIEIKGKKRITPFIVNSFELDALYKIFRDNNFLSIGIRQERIYDRGGTTINIRCGKLYATKSNSGFHIIKKGSQKQYKTILNAVEKLIIRKIGREKATYFRNPGK